MRLLTLITAAALAFVGPAVAVAAPILGVDFQLTGAAQQSGFERFEAGNPGPGTTPTTTYTNVTGVSSGQISVTVFNLVGGGRTRGSVNGTYANLLGDLVTNFQRAPSADPTGVPPTTARSVEITGLDPNTQYDVRIWSLDRGFNNNSNYKWFDVTGSSYQTIGTIVNVAGGTAPTVDNESDFSVAATLTADANGAIRLSHHDSAGTGTLNGIRISEVPEPTAVVGLGLAGIVLLVRRHRQA